MGYLFQFFFFQCGTVPYLGIIYLLECVMNTMSQDTVLVLQKSSYFSRFQLKSFFWGFISEETPSKDMFFILGIDRQVPMNE
jgi:hypothetical protein